MAYLKTKLTHKYTFIKYNTQTATYIILKIIKNFMRDGRFETFLKILIKGTKQAVIHLYKNCKYQISLVSLLLFVIKKLSPFCDIKALRASGRRVLVPAPLRFQRKIMIAIKFFVHGCFTYSRKWGYSLSTSIKDEIIFLSNERTETRSQAFLKKREFVKNIFYNEKHLRFLKGL